MGKSRHNRGRTDANELINRLAGDEEQFLRREFLAPALPGGEVRVRIAGAVCKVRIQPASFSGWGIFQPASHRQAQLVRMASLAERRCYLDLFPQIPLIVCRRVADAWHAASASFGDARIHLEGLAPLQLVEEVQLFEVAHTRFDGAHFWFDEIDRRQDPGAAPYLRSELQQLTPPKELARSGLTAEQRAAYELNYWSLVPPEVADNAGVTPPRIPLHARRSDKPRDYEEPIDSDQVRRRLRENLSLAGAQLLDYLEREDSFRVRYSVDGRSYTTSVAKEDLTVQVAGICLSGEDQKFDLASMVGVLREGNRGGGIVRVGDEEGMEEQDYWDIHPPTER